MDPPAGSGSLRPPAGGRAAALHLGAAERQGRLPASSPPPSPASPFDQMLSYNTREQNGRNKNSHFRFFSAGRDSQ